MKPIDADGFEAMFQDNTDPWNYGASSFEAFKRSVLLHACGTRHYGRGLELGCANGETSRRLASRCRRLLAVDSSPTVIAAARDRIPNPRIEFRVARLPEQMPHGPFDLIVASEILYYLRRDAMKRLVTRMSEALAPGGRIVLVHHTIPFDDAAQQPAAAQLRAISALSAGRHVVFTRRFGRFRADALVLRH